MKVMNIIHDSIVDGTGLRTVVFFAGCPHFCKGCHNPESWNIKNGKEMTIEEIAKEVCKNPISNVTFSGGDPFYQASEVKGLAKKLKALGKNIWAYTGYTYEELLESSDDKTELLNQCDVLVDGRFVLEQRDLTLKFRGSRNQKIIDVKTGQQILK